MKSQNTSPSEISEKPVLSRAKTTFRVIFKEAKELVMKFFWPMVTVISLFQIVTPFLIFAYYSVMKDVILVSLPVKIAIGILYYAVVVVIGLLLQLTIVRFLHEGEKEKTTMVRALHFSLKRLGVAISLSFRIFLKVFLLMIVAGGGIIVTAAGIVIVGKITQNPDIFKEASSFVIFIFILLVIYAVFGFYCLRLMFKYQFAYPLLSIQEKITAKEAMQKSMKLSKDYLWRIFINSLPFSLLGIIMVYASDFLASIMLNTPSVLVASSHIWTMADVWARVIGYLFALPFIIVISIFAQAFIYIFTKNIMVEKGEEF